MKKLGHLGLYSLLLFLGIYVVELGAVSIAKFLRWGMDGYAVILSVEMTAILLLFIWWLKKKEMLFIFDKKGWYWSIILCLVLSYFVRQFLNDFQDAFQMRYNHLIDHKYLFQQTRSVLYSNGQPTFLFTALFFIMSVIIGPILEETIERGYFMNTFFPKSRYYLDVFLSAFIFALSHMVFSRQDLFSFCYYSLLGLFFALVYRWTKDLKTTILCHSFFNFLIYAKPIWIFVYNYVYYNFFR
ncbi:CPBP family intramembrane glutamic endopeptidase [Streptococcus oralis]|uniref:CAAX prenyl protease 2/Lysostaphin resistance protein A-like domain-containing protein n=1 Tax=Streptococcus oralis TaxID=1303 RepID=A0A139QRJ8_STROR|nr:CPBP family intramembrane glutamic endopeptidase [Streptococcus oralis]KXU04971.1 hypothetical protein SORDD24_00972 [Streptococcus oralis]